MRHQIPGLHSRYQDAETKFNGLFLVRIERAFYRRHPQKPFIELRFVILEPRTLQDQPFLSRLYCTERALWKLHWFLRDFGYDLDLLNRDQVDERALVHLRGIVRSSHKMVNGQSYQNLDSFAPAGEWEVLSCESIADPDAQKQGRDSHGV